MKTSLNHLPEKKQYEINHITEIIKQVVDPEMIILFGSHAKGRQVDHHYQGSDGIMYDYISDYDFLVVVNKVLEETSSQEGLIEEKSQMYEPSVNLEIHEVDFINKGLEVGQYFFADIIDEGIILYNSGNVSFSEPRQLSEIERREIALEYFETWFPQGYIFLKTARFNYSEGDFKIAAFQLHQAAESLYYTLLLVFTGYKPKTHSLKKLRRKSKKLSEDLFLLFQIDENKIDKELFDLLKRGYIDARYKRNYSISKEQVEALIEKIQRMVEIVESKCFERIG